MRWSVVIISSLGAAPFGRSLGGAGAYNRRIRGCCGADSRFPNSASTLIRYLHIRRAAVVFSIWLYRASSSVVVTSSTDFGKPILYLLDRSAKQRGLTIHEIQTIQS
ncbi:hypothetical protein EJ08DRAFT_360740 [Tothia fuscella]|uniref:Uncharacterized protein n=1 Tax=Tothia fuscella TaxID=1048955 RepID=A0A9P4NLZ5_9PEZI|nr:hypothetical protein EJ08DRAFT_360740 [Tothia fuscella]